MSVQAQIREWADEAVRAVLGPVIERLEQAEKRLTELENPRDHKQATAPATAERPAAAKPSAGSDRPSRAARPVSGQKGPSGK